MDLEEFTRRKILEGANDEEIIDGLIERVEEFKKWEKTKKNDFSEALFKEVKNSLGYKTIKDPFLKDLLEYPKSGVATGEFGVGSRGSGDFKVHRDIAEIVGWQGELVGPVDQDDAGVIKGGGKYITMAVDGIHSRLSEFPFLAGFHTARAALRDVYVMGSNPVALLTDLHLADDGEIGKLYDFTAGVSTVGNLTSVPLVSGSTLRVGGDMVFGDRLVAGVGAVGVSENRPFARKYAEEGDVIIMTLGKGGGTIATTAIYSGNFEVIKETLNIDFASSMESIFQSNLSQNVHAMTDVTNGGLRGDANEISEASKTKLVFHEENLRQTVSNQVFNMLTELEIDYLGVSTDSLMLILPKDVAQKIMKILEKTTPVFEVGWVEKGLGVNLVTEDGEIKDLKPLFRESPYTSIKKVMGHSKPENLGKMSKALDVAKESAISKKNAIVDWIVKE
jgi:hydrogenase expression/formation protein